MDRRFQVMERGRFARRGDGDGGKLLGGFRRLVLVPGGGIGGSGLGRESQGQRQDEGGTTQACEAGVIGVAILMRRSVQNRSRVEMVGHRIYES